MRPLEGDEDEAILRDYALGMGGGLGGGSVAKPGGSSQEGARSANRQGTGGAHGLSRPLQGMVSSLRSWQMEVQPALSETERHIRHTGHQHGLHVHEIRFRLGQGKRASCRGWGRRRRGGGGRRRGNKGRYAYSRLQGQEHGMAPFERSTKKRGSVHMRWIKWRGC